MGQKELKTYELSQELFDEILERDKEWVVKVSDLSPYLHGSRFNASIIYDGIKKFVCRQRRLTGTGAHWYQCICVLNDKLEGKTYQKAINGGTAFRRMKKKLLNHYTEEEFDAQMSKHQKEYDPTKSQIHFFYAKQQGIIYKYENCVKYDINGAYAAALIEIFPKAKEEILKIYKERKKKPLNKALINYFVGMMCNKKYKKKYGNTYNYIVQEVSEHMKRTIDYVGGILLYANTDGFVVSNPTNKLQTSKELGDFKLEYEGDVYLYQGENYQVMQTGDKLTGNLFYKVRDKIDLRKGKTVSYKREKDGYTYKLKNIREEEKMIYEENWRESLQTNNTEEDEIWF